MDGEEGVCGLHPSVSELSEKWVVSPACTSALEVVLVDNIAVELMARRSLLCPALPFVVCVGSELARRIEDG